MGFLHRLRCSRSKLANQGDAIALVAAHPVVADH